MKKYILIIILILGALGFGSVNEFDIKNENGNGKTYRIGIIQFMDHVSLDEAKSGFVEELEEKNINYEIIDISANGDLTLIPTLAQKLNGRNLDLIYTIATPAAQGVKNQIVDIPIIFSAVTDPVGAGLIDSFENPNTNVSGVSDYIDPINQIEEFLSLYTNTKTIGVIYNTSEQNSIVQVNELEEKLKEKNIELIKVGITTINDIPQAISSLSTKIDGYFALTDNLVANAAPIVSENLKRYNIPSVSAEEGQVKGGLLMSQGVNYKEQGAQAADMAIKVLQGENIENMPAEYNKVNRKLVNKTTALALGLDINQDAFKDAEIVE